MKDKCCRYLIFCGKKTHRQGFWCDKKFYKKNVSKQRVQMFLFYCQNIVLGSSRISIFDCQGSFETFLMIVIFCWQTVLFLAAYPPSVTVVAIQHYIVSMQEERYRARGNTYHEWNYRVPSTPFASARAKRTIIYNFAFVPCLCVRVAMVTLVSGPGSIINQAGPRQRRGECEV